MAKSKDEIVQELIQKLKIKKNEILEAEKKPVWKTNLSFSFDESSTNRINLNVITDLKLLTSILAFLNVKEESFNIAAKTLNVKEKFTYLGFSKKDWEEDLIAKCNKIQINEKKAEAKKLEEGLEKFISVEERERLELLALTEAIEKF